MLALRHAHHLKHHQKQKSPHPHFPNFLIYLIAIIGPAITIDQIYLIFSSKNASAISLTTWGIYTLLAIFWIFYGASHKDKPIILTNIGWVIANGLVMLGGLLYGGKPL